MRRSLAPSSVANTIKGSAASADAPDCQADHTAKPVLPARTKRKFAPPASVAPARTAASIGVPKSQVCNTVPIAQDTHPSQSSEASAQYFSVLYTKRAANKVSPYKLLGNTAFWSAETDCLCICTEKENQVLLRWRPGSKRRQCLYPLQ